MTDHENKVRAQFDKFCKALPELLKTMPGRWVVYLDGVRYATDNEHDARRVAIKFYGLDAGYVIAQVVEPRAIHTWEAGLLGAAIDTKAYADLQAENTSLRTTIREFADDKAGMAETIDQLGIEVDRLRGVADAARGLVAKLPRCKHDGCESPAMRAHVDCDGWGRWCDEHGDVVPDYGHAQPLRDTIATLAKLDKETG